MVHFNDYIMPDIYDKVCGKNYSTEDVKSHEIKELLGEGAFGKVYLATLKGDEEEVAIKKISKEKGKPEVFQKEYDDFKVMLHPFLIQYYGYYESETHYNFVLEYAPGGDLAQQIRERKSTSTFWMEDDICKLVTDIVVGLEYMHDNDVIHRDLKPDNLVVGYDGTLKITDFGIAKVMDDTGNKALYASKIGTRCYAAPELLANKKYDSSVDYWSLGVILHEMCSLNHPAMNMIHRSAGKKIQRIPQKYSKELAFIVEWCLEMDPAERMHEEDFKMEQKIKPHYQAAIKQFTQYWECKILGKLYMLPDYCLYASDDEDD